MTVKKPVGWMVSSLFNSLAMYDPMKNINMFVSVKAVESKSIQLLQHLNSLTTCKIPQLLAYEDFVKESKNVVADKRSLELVLELMKKNKMIIVENVENKNDSYQKVVKFASSQNSPVTVLSETEKNSVQMNLTYELVCREKNQLMQEKEELEKEILSLVRNKQKLRALPLLKRVKRIEKKISMKEGCLMKLEEVQEEMSQHKMNAKVLESLKAGNTAMKEMRKELDVDEVDKVMGEVADSLDETEEINNLISSMNMTSQDDDDELEAELQELLLEDIDLPKVPALFTPVTDLSEPQPGISNEATNIKKSRPSMQ